MGVQRTPADNDGSALDLVKRHYQSRHHLRRGICLLNAGQHDLAAREFNQAAQLNPAGLSLPSLLAACHVKGGRFDLAAAQMERAVRNNPANVTARIRRALMLWRDSRLHDAVEYLREGLVSHPDSAELHFQLGTMLAAAEDLEPAELHFTQAVAIAKNHTDAIVGLAQCFAVAGRVAEAKKHLERAQRRRPHDARVALLLSQACKALADRGIRVGVQAVIPDDAEYDHSAGIGADDAEGLNDLSRIAEREPDFVDAFLMLPAQDLDAGVYSMLAEALNRALERRPEQPTLHLERGQVLDRLGRPDEAIAELERAVELDPAFVRALIVLAKLYQRTDRLQDATARLEQVLRLGVEYADVYYLLGNLYRGQGEIERARWAYVSALRINERFEAARTALQSLAA